MSEARLTWQQYRLTWQQYSALPGVNWSKLKWMLTSPKHYRWFVEHPTPDSPAFALGRAVHLLVLEPERLSDTYTIWQGDRRAGKLYEKFVSAAKGVGLEVVRNLDLEEAYQVADAVRRHPVAAAVLREGRAERSISWQDPDTNVWCKGRIDWLTTLDVRLQDVGVGGELGATVVCDLKTSRDITTEFLTRSFDRCLYHAQMAFYADGCQADVVVVIVVESVPPYDVRVLQIPIDVLEVGRTIYKRCLRRMVEVVAANDWRGVSSTVEEYTLPRWAELPDTEIEF